MGAEAGGAVGAAPASVLAPAPGAAPAPGDALAAKFAAVGRASEQDAEEAAVTAPEALTEAPERCCVKPLGIGIADAQPPVLPLLLDVPHVPGGREAPLVSGREADGASFTSSSNALLMMWNALLESSWRVLSG